MRDYGYMHGYVRCACGSKDVRGHARRGIKSRRIVAVDYHCGSCGARLRVGASEFSVPAHLSDEELRARGYCIR